MITEPILTKATSVHLWRAGAFGNKLRSWTVEEWRESSFDGVAALRVKEGPGAGLCAYHLKSRVDVERMLHVWLLGGASTSMLMVNEQAPSELTIIQGEYRNGVWADGTGAPKLDTFKYSHERCHMREAFKLHTRTSHGLTSNLILKEAMTPASYEDWQDLLDRYPEHVLEVSVYDRCLGDLPHRNALVWEVRRY